MNEFRVKLIENGKLPERKIGDAGYDLFSRVNEILPPNVPVKIPLGITTEFSPAYVAILKDRSSMAAKGIHILGGVIDSSYRGEWQAVLINLGTFNYVINEGDKICQALLLPVSHCPVISVNSLSETNRGEGGFGSTGK